MKLHTNLSHLRYKIVQEILFKVNKQNMGGELIPGLVYGFEEKSDCYVDPPPLGAVYVIENCGWRIAYGVLCHSLDRDTTVPFINEKIFESSEKKENQELMEQMDVFATKRGCTAEWMIVLIGEREILLKKEEKED